MPVEARVSRTLMLPRSIGETCPSIYDALCSVSLCFRGRHGSKHRAHPIPEGFLPEEATRADFMS